MRGRKPKPWWDNNKKAWYATVHGRRYRLGTTRPRPNWSDEAWINYKVLSADLKVDVTLPPDYKATPEFVRSCMPARGQHKLSVGRLQRVADKLLELYGPDAYSLMEYDVTGEPDLDGVYSLRGLAWDIDKIVRVLYDEDRQLTQDLYSSPRERPEYIPLKYRRIRHTRGKRCNYAPGTRQRANDKKFLKPPPRPRYVDYGETAEEREPLPKPLPPGYIPDTFYRCSPNRQERRELLNRLEQIAVTPEEKALERQHKIRRGLIQVTDIRGDVPRVAYPKSRILSP
jgi:hypothetical protein